MAHDMEQQQLPMRLDSLAKVSPLGMVSRGMVVPLDRRGGRWSQVIFYSESLHLPGVYLNNKSKLFHHTKKNPIDVFIINGAGSNSNNDFIALLSRVSSQQEIMHSISKNVLYSENFLSEPYFFPLYTLKHTTTYFTHTDTPPT